MTDSEWGEARLPAQLGGVATHEAWPYDLCPKRDYGAGLGAAGRESVLSTQLPPAARISDFSDGIGVHWRW
jgi:hypothetical protein